MGLVKPSKFSNYITVVRVIGIDWDREFIEHLIDEVNFTITRVDSNDVRYKYQLESYTSFRGARTFLSFSFRVQVH
jgi:hypothetical protein